MYRNKLSCNIRAFGINSNYHLIHTAINMTKNDQNWLSFWNPRPYFFGFHYLRDAMLARYLLSSCVSPSVTSWCSTKTAKPGITQTTPYDGQWTLGFWRQQSLVGDAPFPLKVVLSDPPLFQKQRFRPILFYSASVRASEKCSISTNRKSTTHFPTSHRWTV